MDEEKNQTTSEENPAPPEITSEENPAPPEETPVPPLENHDTYSESGYAPDFGESYFEAGTIPVPPVQSEANTSRWKKKTMSPEKHDKFTARWLKVVAVLLVVLIVYCIVSDVVVYRTGGVTIDGTPVATGTTVVIEQQSKPIAENDEVNPYSVEGVAEMVRPSVVEIWTYLDEEYTEYYCSGSGIVLTESGYIVTNAHVVSEGVAYLAVTSDEEVYVAELVGSDTKTDLAVIQIHANNLTPAVIGNSDEVALGENVVAIGNPAGLSGTVTSGVVSGIGRYIRSNTSDFSMECIQTDAALNPGNSGGALVNLYGQVIGITSSKYMSSYTSYEGLGFAITINEALPILADLIENGYVSGRPRFGITLSSLEIDFVREEFCAEIGMESAPDDMYGVWILEIDPESDMNNTELQINDVIIAVNGQTVTCSDDLTAAIDGCAVGDKVTAICRRYDASGNFTEFEITFRLIEEKPDT